MRKRSEYLPHLLTNGICDIIFVLGMLFLQPLEYNDKQGYTIKNSPATRDKLFKFFNNYGKKGIKINIGF